MTTPNMHPSTLTPPLTPDTSHLIPGVAASSGAHTGPARILTTPQDAARVQPGDVIVCTAMSPAFAVAIARAGAVVSDAGGTLSNSATIARERRIPAVVATRDATRRIRDGQRLTVDGARGFVRLLP